MQAARKVGALNLSQFLLDFLISSTLISSYTSITSIRLPLNHVQTVLHILSYHWWYDIQSQSLRAPKINTHAVNVDGFKLLTEVIVKTFGLLPVDRSLTPQRTWIFRRTLFFYVQWTEFLWRRRGLLCWGVETEFMISLYDKDDLSTHSHICLKYKLIR